MLLHVAKSEVTISYPHRLCYKHSEDYKEPKGKITIIERPRHCWEVLTGTGADKRYIAIGALEWLSMNSSKEEYLCKCTGLRRYYIHEWVHAERLGLFLLDKRSVTSCYNLTRMWTRNHICRSSALRDSQSS
ncbi:unnamed protein product [Moneuplotes crassus]|uniref:Uncharacterized protein n=1 Tax=Euplotes crassus TaxID=5936 RepID=A0AAD1XL30_EUPCR|nr:unnamed protein product [Moneuplotes crassus]